MRCVHPIVACMVGAALVAGWPRPVRAAESGPPPKSDPGPESAARAKPDADAKPEADAKPDADAKPEPEPDAKPEPDADAKPDPSAEPDAAVPVDPGAEGGACREPAQDVTPCDEGLLCHATTCMTAERRDALEAERRQAEAEAAAAAEAKRKADAQRAAEQERHQAELRKQYGLWLGAAKTEQDIRVVAIRSELDDINAQMEKPRRTAERTRYTTDRHNKRWALAMTGVGAALFLSGIAVNAFVDDDDVRLGAGLPLFAGAGLSFVYPIVFTVGARRHTESTTTLRGLTTRSTVLRAELVTASAPLPSFDDWSSGR